MFLNPTEKPERTPPVSMANSILLKTSMTMTNNNGDKGSPCFKLQELLNDLDGLPFTKTEMGTKKIQCTIQEHHFPPKLHLLNKYNKNSRST
jgi:hypothetical protein